MASNVALAGDALAPAERGRLAQLERTIERGLTTFIEVGSALVEIRDERLYRETHATFEEYCRERWGMARSRAYQLIDASAVADRLSTMVDKAPDSERQVRPLKRLEDPQEQAEAWQEAVDAAAAEGRKPTARDVEAVVERRRPKPEPVPPPEPEEESGDLVNELEAANRRIAQLETENESLSATDLHREIRVWSAKYAQLEGRLRQETERANAAIRQAKGYRRTMDRLCKLLHVQAYEDIVPAVEVLVEQAKVA